MTRNILRAPLIKSATLLAVVSLLVYLTATSSEGSLLSSLGTLFTATFRIVQLGLGLIVALLFCMAVLTGIFLGSVAMVSRESAAKMVEQCRHEISDKLLFVRSLVIRDVPSRGARVLAEYDSVVKKEMLATMEDSLGQIRQNHAAAVEKIESVMQRLDRIEQGEDITSLVIHQEKQDGYVQGLVVKAEQIQDQVMTLQKKVDELIRSSRDEQVDPAVAELGGRIDSFEKILASLQDDLSCIKDASEAEDVQGKRDGNAGKESVDHRFFSYLKSKAMQTKIEQLVTETLDKEMSYAQVIDHLVAQTKGKTADIIATHPSLVKDYIRYRRNNG